jgi:PST family polysaccharide transporter
MAALRRLLPSAATGRFVPVGGDQRADVVQPPTDVAPHEIEGSVKRGAAWALGSQIATQALRLVGVAVLARLLTPDDYGAAALAITIASFSMILGDLGYGSALVQASTASQRRASTAFWCALGAGAVCSGCVALGAYPASLALDDPEVTALAAVGGITLLLVALGSTSNALLTRAMSFGVIQGASMIAWLVATPCAIVAAAIGAGAWALVVQQVVLAAVMSACVIVPARWRPSLQFSRADLRSLTRFAVPYTGASAFFLLQQVVTVLLVGHFVGIEALGIWNLSMAIVFVPLSLLAYPVSRVIYAAFARMRDSQERVAEMWLKGFTLLAAVVLPALFLLIAVAPDVVPVAFGSQWRPAVPVVQILCVLVMSRTLQTWNEAVMDAAGKPHVAMLLTGSVLVALLPSIWLGSAFGIEGVAVAYCVASLICGELPSFVLTTRELSLKGLSVLRCLQGIVPACAAACIAVVFVRHGLEELGLLIEPRILLSVAVGVAVYVLCLTLFARSVARQLLGIASALLAKIRHRSGVTQEAKSH